MGYYADYAATVQTWVVACILCQFYALIFGTMFPIDWCNGYATWCMFLGCCLLRYIAWVCNSRSGEPGSPRRG